MKALAGLLLFAAMSMAPNVARADCAMSPLILCAGCTVDRQITIAGGTTCRIASRFGGGVISTKTLVRPRHGIFAHAAAYDFAYQVQAGYKGEDYFEYEVVYRDVNGQSARAVVRNKVTAN